MLEQHYAVTSKICAQQPGKFGINHQFDEATEGGMAKRVAGPRTWMTPLGDKDSGYS